MQELFGGLGNVAVPHFEPEPQRNILQPSGETVPFDSMGEIRNFVDTENGESWHTVNDDDELHNDDGCNHDSNLARLQIRNQHIDRHGIDRAALLPVFLPLAADDLPPNDNALNIAVVDHHDGIIHGNLVEDNNAQDDMNNDNAQDAINNDDGWDIDDWNEGIREGWDWVPLAVVCFYI